MKTIAGYTLMGFGAYYLLVELSGIGAILSLFKTSKQYMPKYQEQITQIEKKIAPQISQFNSSKPQSNSSQTQSNLPQPNQEEKKDKWGAEFTLETPWTKLETKANAK